MTSETTPLRAGAEGVTSRTYLGLFLIALATLMYEILLTRIFSVTMLYHFAFVAISVAMFGMTVGALIVYLFPRVFRAETAHRDLAVSAALFSPLILLSFLTQLSVPFRIHPSIVAIYAIVFTYAVIAVPFVAGGIAVSVALTRFPSRVSRLYAADLAGAALGCVLIVPVLGSSDAPTAVLVVATLAAFAAVCFAWDVPSPRLRRATAAFALLMSLATAVNFALVLKQFPLFRILYIHGAFEARPLYEQWNSYSRVRVNGDAEKLIVPTGWGLSQRMPQDLRVRQLQMDIDITAGTVMTAFDGDLSAVGHLRYDVTNVGYYLRERPRVLVVGAGGGRDVLSALAFGAGHVTAVEINKDIIGTVNGRFGDFTGHLDRRPDVTFVVDEARSYIARTPAPIDFLQISLIDTWAATAAGAFVLSENALYTSEAWKLFLSRLSERGLLSVSRWYFRDRPAEMYRTLTLAEVSLRAAGVADPRAHVVIVRNMQLANKPDMPDGVGTLLVSRAPFTAAELDRLDAVAADLGYDVMLSPRVAVDPLFVELLDPVRGPQAAANFAVNISPPTDDSPFFFNMLRLRDVAKWNLLESGKQSNNMKAVFVLAVLLATVLVLTTLCIVVPLWLGGNRQALEGSGGLLTYFAMLGLGFMLIETSQMQRLIIVLGHPTYGLTVVLFALLVSSGIGSYLTSGVSSRNISRAATRRMWGLVVVLVLFGLMTPWIVHQFEGSPTWLRIAVATAVLVPAGLLMGMGFPLGMLAAGTRAPQLTPWLWGVNGATSVLASVLSVCIALTWSISAAFWTGTLCYAVAALCLTRVVSATVTARSAT